MLLIKLILNEFLGIIKFSKLFIRMEFAFNCEKCLGVDAEGFAIIDGKKGAPAAVSNPYNRGTQRGATDQQSNMFDIIDRMGAASSKA
jgi:hypothetical protein